MTGGGDHPHPHRLPRCHHIPVRDPHPAERHLVSSVHEVGRAGLARERESPGDVIVVDMGFEHVRHRNPAPGGHLKHPVNVTLRVHHYRSGAIGGQVGPVTQRGRVDRHDLDH